MEYLLITVFLFSSLKSFSQGYKPEDFSHVVKINKTGAQILFESKKHLFSLNILSPKIEQKQDGYLVADGKLLQYLLVPFPQKIDYDKLSEKEKEGFLLDYNNYEMDYIKQRLGKSDLDEQDQFVTFKGRLYLFWSYKMTASSKKILQFYLVTVCFDHILLLNIPISYGDSSALAEEFLLDIGKSIKIIK